MKNIEDTTRITQRFLLGKGDVDNLSSVQHTIEVWEAIKHKIMLEKSLEEAERSIPANESWKSLDKLLSRIADLRDLAKRISLAVETRTVRKGSLSEEQAEDVDDVSDAATELPFRMYSLPGTEMKWTIKPEYVARIKYINWTDMSFRFSEELSSLHVRLQRLQMEKDKLQDEFQKQYGISVGNSKLKSTYIRFRCTFSYTAFHTGKWASYTYCKTSKGCGTYR